MPVQKFLKSTSTNSVRKTERIRKIFIEWSLMSTSHCYPKIFQYENIYAKIIWAVFFLGFAALTFCFLIFGLLDYFEFEVVSKIRVYNEKVLVYPTITICDSNSFTTKAAEHLLNDVVIQNKTYLDEIKFEKYKSKSKAIDYVMFKLQRYISYGMNKMYYLSDAEKQSMGISLQNILHTCYFNLVPCNASDFNWFYSYMYGNCFQFNSGKDGTQPLKETRLGGYKYGLQLFIRNLTNSNKHPNYVATGLRVFVHNGSYFSSSAQEILVEKGKQTSISIRKTITYREPWPYSECQDLTYFRSELYDYIKSKKSVYRQSDCLELCMQKITIEKCKCFNTLLPIYDKTISPCSAYNETECYLTSLLNALNTFDTKCNLECPLECDYVTYDIATSTLDYPSEQFFDDLKNSLEEYEEMSLDEFKKTHLLLNIFYPYREYTEIKEKPTTSFVDLVSNLGGALGIFLGFSIFSFVEVFEIVIHVLLIVLKKN